MNINGTNSDDLLIGTDVEDTINGLAGRDRLEGGIGNDILNGGDGNDSGLILAAQIAGLFGGAGNDTLNGEAGDDFLSPDEGTYVVDGGVGFDVLGFDFTTATTAIAITYTNRSGTTVGSNTIRNIEAVGIDTGSGNDSINVTATSAPATSFGNAFLINGNFISSGAGDDTIKSGAGIDLLLGGDGNDTLSGGAGNDSGLTNFTTSTGRSLGAQIAGLFGGAGNDILNGGTGDDLLEGGTGIDRLTGGIGADRFTFEARNQGRDIITDFNASQSDRIVVSAAGFGGGLTAGASITAAQFALGTTAADANDRFIYDAATGALRFDRDGTGSIAAIQIATLGNKPALTNASITVIA